MGIDDRTSRPQRVTSTGWRLVGVAADMVVDPAAAPLVAPVTDSLIFAAAFHLRPRIGTQVIGPTLMTMNDWLMPWRRTTEAPAKDNSFREDADRFHALSWETFDTGDHWCGELLWRHVHPTIAGVACTTQVILHETQAQVTMTVAVGTHAGLSDVRGDVGAGQARPALLTHLDKVVRLVANDAGGEPRQLSEREIPGFVERVLLSDDRQHPVAVLAPTEEGGYVVAPATIGSELLGLAPLYVIDRHPTTFRLSDTLGDRRLSCYWGALRIYLPEMSCADDPARHPLLFDERVVDPVVRAGLVGSLARSAIGRLPERIGVSALREAARPKVAPAVMQPTAVVADIAVAAPASEAESSAATVVEREPSALAQASAATLERIAGSLARLVEVNERIADGNDKLLEEMERLREASAVRAAGGSGIERRLGLLERTIRDAIPKAVEPVDDVREPEQRSAEPDAPTLLTVVRQASTTNADALLITDDAERAAAESPYEDINRVAVILDAMAGLARRRQSGTLRMSLREAFRELGIEYRGGISAATSNKLRQQYVVKLGGGQSVACEEHVVLGTSYDPRFCLRIYFSSREPWEPRFVIGHIGRHYDVVTSS